MFSLSFSLFSSVLSVYISILIIKFFLLLKSGTKLPVLAWLQTVYLRDILYCICTAATILLLTVLLLSNLYSDRWSLTKSECWQTSNRFLSFWLSLFPWRSAVARQLAIGQQLRFADNFLEFDRKKFPVATGHSTNFTDSSVRDHSIFYLSFVSPLALWKCITLSLSEPLRTSLPHKHTPAWDLVVGI